MMETKRQVAQALKFWLKRIDIHTLTDYEFTLFQKDLNDVYIVLHEPEGSVNAKSSPDPHGVDPDGHQP